MDGALNFVEADFNIDMKKNGTRSGCILRSWAGTPRNVNDTFHTHSNKASASFGTAAWCRSPQVEVAHLGHSSNTE